MKTTIKLSVICTLFSASQATGQQIDSLGQDFLKQHDLSEVVVKATRANEKTGMTFTNLFKKDIQKQNLGQDIPFLLNQLPSVVVSSDAGAGVGYTGIRIRGTDPTRINVTMNGVPFNDSESQGVYWVNMPDIASSIQSVQVQRGVGTSTNGAGAFGASININTLGYEPDAYGESNVSVGSFNTLKTNLLASTGLLNNHFVVDTRLSRILSDGFIDRSGANLRSFYLSGGYYNKNNFVRLNVFSGKEITKQAWEGVHESVANGNLTEIDAFVERNGFDETYKKQLLERGRRFNPYTYSNQVDDYQQDHYQLISSFQLSKTWRFNPTLHYTYGRGFYEQFRQNDAFENYALPNLKVGEKEITSSDLVRRKWLDNHFYGGVWSFDYEGNKKIKATIGGGWNRYEGDHFGEIIWAKLNPIETQTQHRWYDNKGIKTDFTTYAKLYYEFNKALNGYADVQYRNVAFQANGTLDNLLEVSHNQSFNFFNPKIGLTYSLSETASMYASWAVGNKEPSRQDVVDNAPNVPLHETLQDLEIGYRFNKKRASVEANFYWMNYQNQLVLTGSVNNVGEAIRVNVPKSYRAGIEVQAAYKLATHWKVSGNATFSRNKIAAFTETIVSYDDAPNKITEFKNTDISFSPSVIAGGQLQFLSKKGIELAWMSKFVGKQYLDNTANETRKLDAFFVNDLRASYTLRSVFMKEINFSLLINNVLNEKYAANGYTYSYQYGGVVTENFVYPQAGTNFLLAVRVWL
jgi:iron complex outermembrane recepter protein